MLFEEEEINGYVSRMLEVQKSIYDAIEFDSEVERRFAETLEQREDIRLFVKLPAWFKVETPLGTYNPDWAIVKREDTTLYLVRETKGTTESLKLRPSEWQKIKCGMEHFAALGVDYRSVASADEV
jgi:type III restriction enzyme